MPPAHTDGDSIIHFKGSDVIVVGDVFRTVAFPVIDTNNGGTLPGTIETLGIIAGMAGPDTQIVPGHGVVSSRADVIEFRDMVIDVAERVSQLVSQGMTYEQVVAARPTGQYETKWGSPDRFLRRSTPSSAAGAEPHWLAYTSRCWRGINVGGKHMLPMNDLAAMFNAAGCAGVRTYIQSGNVVFRASPEVAARIPELISRRLSEDFGYSSPVITRTAAELRTATKHNPFIEQGR